MKATRRRFLTLVAGALAPPALSRIAQAQPYPSRPVHLVVGVAAGGSVDIFARLIGQSLSQRLGQSFVVDNRPGAGTNVATEAVVRAPADGYTLLLVAAPNVINTALYEKLNFDFIRDIAPVASIGRVPLVMVVNPSVPVKTVAEFIAHAKANPGKINMASAGIGTTPHVAGELFKMMAGINMVHVPYRGAGPAIADLIAGQVQVLFAGTPEAIEHIRADRLRPLAVTGTARSTLMTDIPTVGEHLPGYEASGFFGVGAPRSTPTEVIDRLNREINAALADPKIKERLADLGGAVIPSSPADFGKLIVDETQKWAKVIRFAGMKAE
jgi:tripartite-type tricarboxylate transporter receptor subunit TctC